MKRFTKKNVLRIYHTFLEAYGSRHWWPGDSPYEVVIGAILTQNTAWKNVVKALDNLKARNLLSPERLTVIEESALAALIRPSGYFNQKAKKIRNFHTYFAHYDFDFQEMGGKETAELREELLQVNGIGPETADCILLYALEKPVFVIDAYTIRLFHRLGYTGESMPYHDLQMRFMRHLPLDVPLYNEYHALIDYHGHHVCKKKPLCGQCVIRRECAYGKIDV